MRRTLVLAWLIGPFAGAAGAAGVELPTRATHEVVYVPPTSAPVRGPRFAPVTLDVYFAFGHSTSAVAVELARRAVERATAHDVRAVIHFGAPGAFGAPPNVELAYEAALEAERQGRLWPLFDRLLRERGLGFGVAELIRAGRDAGLDGAVLEEVLLARHNRSAAERVLREGRALGHGAGELLVNGKRASVWSSDDGLALVIDAARKHAEALLDGGVPLSRLYERLIGEAGENATVAQPAPEPLTLRKPHVDLDGAPQRGPGLAPVTLVIFSNLLCQPCAELAQSIAQVRKAHPGMVREVWKSFVPTFAAGLPAPDRSAAELAFAAAAQGRFWELYDLIAQLRAMRSTLAELEGLAARAGLDAAQLARERQAGRWRAAVERDQLQARALGISFLPAVLVNGALLTAPIPAARLERVVRGELARGALDRLGP